MFAAAYECTGFVGHQLPVACNITVRCRYNAIAYVPYQLERLLWYGLLLCCNSFLVRSSMIVIALLHVVPACCSAFGQCYMIVLHSVCVMLLCAHWCNAFCQQLPAMNACWKCMSLVLCCPLRGAAPVTLPSSHISSSCMFIAGNVHLVANAICQSSGLLHRLLK